MSHTKTTFTIEDAVDIQTRQLAEWKNKLKPEIYNDLEAWATETNTTVQFPTNV